MLFLFLSTSFCFGQEALEPEAEYYGLGDQIFAINAGVMFPLFIHTLSEGIEPVFPDKLTLGAIGTLKWGTYISNNLSLGVELGGAFTFTALERTLVLLPISAILEYTIRFYPFEFVLFGGLGVTFTKLEEDLYFGPIAKPGFSFYWNFNAEWAFGIKAAYWWVPEIYFGDNVPAEQSSFGNFLGVTLSTLYHF